MSGRDSREAPSPTRAHSAGRPDLFNQCIDRFSDGRDDGRHATSAVFEIVALPRRSLRRDRHCSPATARRADRFFAVNDLAPRRPADVTHVRRRAAPDAACPASPAASSDGARCRHAASRSAPAARSAAPASGCSPARCSASPRGPTPLARRRHDLQHASLVGPRPRRLPPGRTRRGHGRARRLRARVCDLRDRSPRPGRSAGPSRSSSSGSRTVARGSGRAPVPAAHGRARRPDVDDAVDPGRRRARAPARCAASTTRRSASCCAGCCSSATAPCSTQGVDGAQRRRPTVVRRPPLSHGSRVDPPARRPARYQRRRLDRARRRPAPEARPDRIASTETSSIGTHRRAAGPARRSASGWRWSGSSARSWHGACRQGVATSADACRPRSAVARDPHRRRRRRDAALRADPRADLAHGRRRRARARRPTPDDPAARERPRARARHRRPRVQGAGTRRRGRQPAPGRHHRGRRAPKVRDTRDPRGARRRRRALRARGPPARRRSRRRPRTGPPPPRGVERRRHWGAIERGSIRPTSAERALARRLEHQDARGHAGVEALGRAGHRDRHRPRRARPPPPAGARAPRSRSRAPPRR